MERQRMQYAYRPFLETDKKIQELCEKEKRSKSNVIEMLVSIGLKHVEKTAKSLMEVLNEVEK